MQLVPVELITNPAPVSSNSKVMCVTQEGFFSSHLPSPPTLPLSFPLLSLPSSPISPPLFYPLPPPALSFSLLLSYSSSSTLSSAA